MSINTKRQPVSLRLSKKAVQLLEALAIEQGITKTAVIELMIRKAAEEAEDKMASVYDLLHNSSEA